MSSTQLAVIGGGPGGYAAAFYAADLGVQVTLVDMEPIPAASACIGGLHSLEGAAARRKVASEAKHAAHWGLTYAEPSIDLDKAPRFKDVSSRSSPAAWASSRSSARHLHPGQGDLPGRKDAEHRAGERQRRGPVADVRARHHRDGIASHEGAGA